MLTLNDIAQDPAHTPQDRACLHLFGYAAGGLDQVPCSRFEMIFPETFMDVAPALKENIPGRRAYDAARKSATRILAACGYVDDPWEHLRLLIRRAGRHDIELHWGALKTAALDSGLKPNEIMMPWVWNLDAEAAGGFERQRLRRAVALFNQLIDIPEIKDSGLLPPEYIGPPPVYDSHGDIEVTLSPKLARILDMMSGQRKFAIKAVWRVVLRHELISIADPDADDLLALKEQITAVSAVQVGYAENTWKLYKQRFFADLRPYATQQDANILPAGLAAIETDDREELHAINALWAQMRFAGIDDVNKMAPCELLTLDTWRAIWTPKRPDLSRNSEKTYRNAARRVLLRAAPEAQDPVRVVRNAWSHLPNEVKVTLAPIRKSAQLAMLRPFDVTLAWVGQQRLPEDEGETVSDTITNLETTIAAAHEAARPCPIQAAWRTLRSTAEDRGFSTRGLGKVETRALEDARTPGDLDLAWAHAIADALPTPDRATFTMALRLLDSMRADAEIALILPAEPISAVQDKRRHGRSPLPETLKLELGALAKASGMSDNTLRTWRSAAAALSNITGAQTLADLLSAPQSAQHALGDRHRRVIGHIKKAKG